MSDFEFKKSVDADNFMLPNIWDLVAFALTFCVFLLMGQALQSMALNDVVGRQGIDLSVTKLPKYASYSVARMFIALFFSLLITFVFGTLAARSRIAERIIIPLVDVLQSIPILGYLTVAATVFVEIFRLGSFGFEMVACVVIVTSQVWNMILSFYQSLVMMPADLQELAAVMQLRRIQKFWRVDVPFAMPDLLMNMMVSLSAGWFYIMESEAIVVSGNPDRVLLPGLGSYMWQANLQQDTNALLWALFTMFVVILCYDQLIFRPLMHWIRVYQATDGETMSRSWIVNLLLRTRWFKWSVEKLRVGFSAVLLQLSRYSRPVSMAFEPKQKRNTLGKGLCWTLGSVFVWLLVYGIWQVLSIASLSMVLRIFLLGFYTFLRVFVLLFFCMLLWVPIGVWVGYRPTVANRVMPVIQFLAAFPPNMLYPLLMEVILLYGLNVNIWCAPLMLLGTQWYILFNVISAVQSLDKELVYVTKQFGVKGIILWKRLLLPAIAPHLISGAMAASGGAWNASIVAEVLTWGGETKLAAGLGSIFIWQPVEEIWTCMCLRF